MDSVGALRINISKLSPGIHQYSLVADATELGLEGGLAGPVSVKSSIEKSGSQLFLQVSLTTSGTFTCDRCIDDFTRTIAGAYSVVYALDRGSKERTSSTESELLELSADANFLDLDEDVRQYALLAVPLKLLCKDDCAGLCPTCGKNRNRESCKCEDETVDPRWEGLRDISSN